MRRFAVLALVFVLWFVLFRLQGMSAIHHTSSGEQEERVWVYIRYALLVILLLLSVTATEHNKVEPIVKWDLRK